MSITQCVSKKQLVILPKTRLYFFAVFLLLQSCIHGGTFRGQFYTASLRPYGIFQSLAKGDSIVLALGDTIPFRYSKNKIGYEKGELLVKRNRYNNIEFYELGEWSDSRKSGLITKGFFERENGLVAHKQWYRYDNVDYLLSDLKRFIRNDSLIESQKWYYSNGKLQSERTYLVKRGHKKRQLDFEKRIEIGKWKYYSVEGNPTRRKSFNKFNIPAE